MAAQKKTSPHMADDDKRFIYEVLKRNFSFDEEYPLANLGWCFLREGIDKADFGFIKLKPMLEEMSDFVAISTKEIGGVSQSMFTLRESDGFEKEPTNKNSLTRKKNVKDNKVVNDGIEAKNQKDTNREKEPERRRGESSRKRETGADAADGASACSEDSSSACDANGAAAVEGREEPDAKTQAACGGAQANEGAQEARGGQAESVETSDSGAAVRSGRQTRQRQPASKAKAKTEGSSDEADPSNAGQTTESAKSAAGQAAAASAKGRTKSRSKAKQDSEAEEASSRLAAVLTRPLRGRVTPGKALERFADLGSWPEFLSNLASLALEEPWDFCEVPGIDTGGMSSKRYDILHNYIRYTFYRLSIEDKVAFSDDERFAAFNTGLVDKHYEDIYACFEPAAADGRQEWAFVGFCTAGTGRFGKRLVREMNPLPQPASYLQRKEDLLFDLDREVVCDIRHIVVDNVHRLPMNFLRDELASSAECRGVLAGIEDLTERGRTARFDRLRAIIADDPRLFTRLSNSINAAIDQARRQVRWNYKTAVPAYYPRTNSMNLLLPLNLTEATTPDVALVVELQKSGNYQGQTIVTMAQAYRDARLLCRPYIDWLSPASIIDAASDEDEDE